MFTNDHVNAHSITRARKHANVVVDRCAGLGKRIWSVAREFKSDSFLEFADIRKHDSQESTEKARLRRISLEKEEEDDGDDDGEYEHQGNVLKFDFLGIQKSAFQDD